MTSQRFAVLGAGMVGVCCALELQARGHAVTLIERSRPAAETSHGNAGVVARSSLVPLNNPGLWKQLPTLLQNRSAALRYNAAFLVRHPMWGLRFLRSAQMAVFEETAQALDALIRLSTERHRFWTQLAGAGDLWRDSGWFYAYRSALACEQAAATRAVWSRWGVDHAVLNGDELRQLEPGLNRAFEAAVWVKDALSVSSPQQVVQAYADAFVHRGGVVQIDDCRSLAPSYGAGWTVRCAQGGEQAFDQVVVALGPWSPDALAPLGLKVPMAFERGYHMHYGWTGEAALTRPVYDTAAACVLSPMSEGVRLTTGVELTDRDAPNNLTQLGLAETSVRSVLPLGERLQATPWRGSRPTLPDSRPMIGPASRHKGLWLAFGHQHIGFSTGPGTAAMLGAMVDGQVSPIDTRPFSPARFGL
jgi:D-amino-acid dehydrogenase